MRRGPAAITRAWCLFELTTALDLGKVLHVALSPADHAGFVALLERDFFLNHLEELNLSDNDIADEGLRALAAALGDGHLRKMTSLYLSANKITNEGAFALAAAAKGAKKLPELYDMRLDYQLVGWDGRRAIVEAFKERGQKVSVILKNLE